MALVVGLGTTSQAPGAHAGTVDLEVDVVTYCVDPDTSGQGATLVGFNRIKIARSLTIPATVTHNGTAYPVKRIGEEELCSARLQAVMLPGGPEEIGKAALYGNSINDLVIPDLVVGISEQASMNNHMKTVALPKKLARIKMSIFVNNNLTPIGLPAGLTITRPAAFASCRLVLLILPESVTSIGISAFETSVLTSVTIPKGLAPPAAGIFSSSKPTLVEIPETVTLLGSEVPAGSKFISLKLSKSTTTTPERTLHSNTLTSVTLPEGLTEIQEAVLECDNLTLLTIPAKVITIAEYVFGSNTLTSVGMEDPAPSTHAPSRWNPNVGSFGDPRNPKVSYYYYLSDGYTRPTWSGYTLADECIVVTARGGGATEPARSSLDPNADDDDDGSINGEEVEAGTNPFDSASHPVRPIPPSSSTVSPASTSTGVIDWVMKPVRPGLPRTGVTNS